MSEAGMEQCDRCKKNITGERQFVCDASKEGKWVKVGGRL